jgi:hypothetical protein
VVQLRSLEKQVPRTTSFGLAQDRRRYTKETFKFTITGVQVSKPVFKDGEFSAEGAFAEVSRTGLEFMPFTSGENSLCVCSDSCLS